MRRDRELAKAVIVFGVWVSVWSLLHGHSWAPATLVGTGLFVSAAAYLGGTR